MSHHYKKLSTHLLTIFQDIDSISILSHLHLEDLKTRKNTSDLLHLNYRIIEMKFLNFLEEYCENILDRFSIFLNNKKFISNVKNDCILFDDIPCSFERIKREIFDVLKLIDTFMFNNTTYTQENVIYIRRLKKFLASLNTKIVGFASLNIVDSYHTCQIVSLSI